jgi:ATP-binding cassette subfamily B protein
MKKISIYKKEFYKKNHVNYIGAILSQLLYAGVQISIAFVLQMVLDIANGGTMKEFRNAIAISAIIMLAMILILWIKKLFMNRFLNQALKQYKNLVFMKIFNKNINSFHKESVSTYLSAFSNDLNSIEQNYLIGSFNIILQIALFIGGFAAMAYYNWRILVCTMLVSLLPILVSALYGNRLVHAETKVSEENTSFLALVKDLLAGFPVIKSFKADKEIIVRFKQKNKELELTKKVRRDINDTIAILNTLSGIVVEITVFGLGVYFALRGIISAGVVVAFIQLLNYVLGPISSIGQLVANRKAAESLIGKIEEIAEARNELNGRQILTEFKEAVVYEDVSFGYEEGIQNIRNISLRFEKNKSYAIVGGSGSGKSTLLNLLLGYHNDYKGNIKIDSHELREISTDSLYDIVSMIQQHVFVFDNSIRDNISLFREFDQEVIDNAIERAGLSDLIREKGEDYSCGENGANLSGGEKQRISIARCLVRGTPILLMDEATAALDSTTSHMVEEAILSIKDLTKIIVTHKMEEGILRKYDHIIVMNQGGIVEQGRFNELLELKGYFYSLYAVNNIHDHYLVY